MLADISNCESDRIVFNKTVKSISFGIEIKYKEDTSLVNPTFIVRASDIEDTANYIYVYGDEDEVTDPTIVNRFYFINEMQFSGQKVYLHCSIDPLMSFHDDILPLKGIVERNAQRYNLYLNDDKLKCFNMSRFETIPFPHGFYDDDVQRTKTFTYILAVNGGSDGN